MRVVHVTGSYPPTIFNTGPPQQIHALAMALRPHGVDVRVVTTNANGPGTLEVPAGRWVERDGVPVFYGRRLPGTADVSIQAWRALRAEVHDADAIHVTGIFGWFNIAVDRAAVGRCPVIVSPRGSLDPSALLFGTSKKSWFLRLGGRRALQRAAAFHVTSEMEHRHVAAFLPGAATGVVPNGVDVPSEASLARWAGDAPRAAEVVFLGRIHPKKNVLTLIQAWKRVVVNHPDARLIVAGPDDRGHRSEVERFVATLGLRASVAFPGRVQGEETSRLLARAACLVLPSQTENFGNVVAEALAHRVPVIASTGTPWSGLRDHACGFWVDPTEDGLAGAIDEALRLTPDTRAAMGERGRQWMLDEHAWPSVARRMAGLYLDVVSRAGGRRT